MKRFKCVQNIIHHRSPNTFINHNHKLFQTRSTHFTKCFTTASSAHHLHTPYSSAPNTSLVLAHNRTSTIFSVASGPLEQRSGVAVVRISGVHAQAALTSLRRRADGTSRTTPPPRQATLTVLRHPLTQELIDSQVLVIFFPSPHSFTGEDIIELHCHGSPVVVAHLYEALRATNGKTTYKETIDMRNVSSDERNDDKVIDIRLAEPGEFTRRAFGHGKLDMMQVEGLADLLDSNTALQKQQALLQMSGHMTKIYMEWRQELVENLAHLEAVIDFAEDEDDVGEATLCQSVDARIKKLCSSMKAALYDERRGEILREGVRVSLAGPVNSGKSSLLNHIAQRDVAIVSHRPGTTRDVIETSLNIGGVAVVLADTAGLRDDVDDDVEREGINRARVRMADSDVVLIVVDTSTPNKVLDAELCALAHSSANVIVAANKSDLVPEGESATTRAREMLHILPEHAVVVPLSCHTGNGISDLLNVLQRTAAQRVGNGTDVAQTIITRQRHRQHIEDCYESLQRSLNQSSDLALKAEAIRVAIVSLGKLTGRVDIEEVLDVIFDTFCIGK